MAEEKKTLEFEELTPEQQDDVLRELEEAISTFRGTEADIWEADATISENVTRIRETGTITDREAAEIRAMPRGPERATRARALAETIRTLSEAEVNQARSYGQYLRNSRELGAQRSRLEELRRKARLV